MLTTFLIPFSADQSAIGTVDCASVKLVRTIYGDFSVMIDVPAAVTISGVLDSVASGATASAAGVTPKPARKVTLSLTIRSCAMRFELSGTAPSSLMMSSIFLPATVSPFCCMHNLAPASSCLPVDCCWPVIGRMKPILTYGACAPLAVASAATAHAAFKNCPNYLDFLPEL